MPVDKKLSELTLKSSPAGTLQVELLDPNDTTDAPTGSSFRAALSTLGPGLGLGTASTHPVTDFLAAASNLSDLASAGTARTNLGLGTAAVKGAAGSGSSLPTIVGSPVTGHVALWDASGGITDGGTPGGTGTVTNVGLGVPTGFGVSGTPVTGSGTLAFTVTATGILKGNGSGGMVAATAGVDYELPLTVVTKSAPYTLAANEFANTDATSGTIAHTLPTAPANGSRAGGKMIATASTNVVTLTCGGSDVINRAGGPTTYTLSLTSQGVTFEYNGGIWTVISDDLPLAQLDARYSNAAFLTSGTVATTRLGSGSASSTTFLRGDNTWATPAGGGTPGGSSGQLQYNSTSAFAGAAWSAVATSGSLLTITAGAASDIPLTIAATTSQSGLLTKWLDSTGHTIVSVGPDGAVSDNIVRINMTGAAATHISLDSAGSQVGTIGLQGTIFKLGGTEFQGTFTKFAYNGPRLGYLTTDPLGASTTVCQAFTTAPTLSGAAGYTGFRLSVAEVTVGSGTMIHTQWDRGAGLLFGLDRFCRPLTGGTAPGIAAGTGAGTSPTVSLAGNDVSGVVTITTGTTPSASATVATITFANAYAAAPKAVYLIGDEVNAAALTGTGAVFAGSAGISTTVWTMTVGSSALAAATTYKFKYLVIG